MHLTSVTSTAVALAALLCASCSGVAKDQEESQGVAKNQAQTAQSIDPALLAAAQQARQTFADGAPSVDALMDEFVQALSQKDMDALSRLRVTNAEYVDLIVPGTVPVGKPPRQVSNNPKEFFWRMLDTKNHYFAEELLNLYGGRTYRSRQLTFSKPAKEYAWYKAHGEVRLDLEGDDDVTYHVRSGWVAEVDGKYKFIGYGYND